ncbi:MAG: aminopeptidase P family protein [Deltaproteobacteria bacterium]|nr:aminopeptidase P family protein [Deltaproteobacteria bacterium]
MTSDAIRNEIRHRVDRLQGMLREHNLDGALFVQKVDVYYLSRTDQAAHLWVPARGAPLLMVRKSIERAKADAAIDQIISLPGFSDLPRFIEENNGFFPGRIGLEMDVLPVNQYRIYRELFPETEMVDVSMIIRSLRMIKSPSEISAVSRAAEMGDRMFQQVPSILRHAETETDLALQLEAFSRSQGHPGIVRTRAFNMECFYGHVLAGKNAAAPRTSSGPTGGTGTGPFSLQGAGFGKILPHEPILVDYTSSVDGYVSGQARIFSLGELPEHFIRAHQVMIEVQDMITRNARPGVRAGDLYARALEVVKGHRLEKGFMGYPDPAPFVGHGIGLELDEWPIIGQNSTAILQEGMIFALEPKMIFPGEGVTGIENVFVVTSDGLKKLNQFPDPVCVC